MEIKDSNIKCIIGIGNPGEKHKGTYHNVGYLCIDFLQKNLPPTEYKIIKSNTFMNNSGIFVKEKMDELKLKPENLLIVQDDSDIEIGDYKFSFGKGSAGHKGIESIIEKVGSKNIWRARIGIRPENEDGKAKEFVLKKISPEHRDDINEVFWKLNKTLKEVEK